MRILRFIFPFLFVRNWYDGSWELSRARTIIVVALTLLVVLGVAIAYTLQSPVIYTNHL